jgi:hypoxanthine phosphoribosyltransferase
VARTYIKLSYEEARDLSLALYRRIRSSGWLPDVNVGIGRGGMFVLRSLQDFFAAEGVRAPYWLIPVERYSGIGTAGSVRISGEVDVAGMNVLLVDDVADYGDSLAVVRELLLSRGASSVRTATLHLKPWSKVIPDYYVSRTDAWIIYPWELYETIAAIIRELAAAGATVDEAYGELVSRAHVTPQELANFSEMARRGGSLDARSRLILEGLLSAYGRAGNVMCTPAGSAVSHAQNSQDLGSGPPQGRAARQDRRLGIQRQGSGLHKLPDPEGWLGGGAGDRQEGRIARGPLGAAPQGARALLGSGQGHGEEGSQGARGA